jgi:hypothetical protein
VNHARRAGAAVRARFPRAGPWDVWAAHRPTTAKTHDSAYAKSRSVASRAGQIVGHSAAILAFAAACCESLANLTFA